MSQRTPTSRARRGNPARRPGPALCARNFERGALSSRACTTRGSSRGPSATKYRWAAFACSSAVEPWPKRRRSFEPIWNSPRYWPFWALVAQAGLAARDREGLAAVRSPKTRQITFAGVRSLRGQRAPALAVAACRCDELRPSRAAAFCLGARRGSRADVEAALRLRGRKRGSRNSQRWCWKKRSDLTCPSSSCSGGCGELHTRVRGRSCDCAVDAAYAQRIEGAQAHRPGLSGSDLHLGDRVTARAAVSHRAVPARVSRLGHRSEPTAQDRRASSQNLGKLSQRVVWSEQRETPPCGGVSRLRDRDSNPNFRSQNPASYH